MLNIVIRTPNFNEIKKILIILSQAFNRPIPPDIQDQEKLIIDLIKNEIAHFIIIEQNDKICGLGAAFFFGKVCSFGYMAVLQNYRNKRFGTRVFSSLMDYASHYGCVTFTLYASNLGEPIYRKFGFQGRFYETMYYLPKKINYETPSSKEVRIEYDLPKWAIELDYKAIGFDRSHYLNILINHGSKLLIIENEGYSLISSNRLGPLIVKNLNSAVILIREGILHGADHIIIPKHSKLPMGLFDLIKLTETGGINNLMMIKGKELHRKLEYFYALDTYAKG
jgi:GNAT superfamily N-acetyltransferase